MCNKNNIGSFNTHSDKRAGSGSDLASMLAGLGRGEALVLGEAVPLPTRVHFDRPEPVTNSDDVKLTSTLLNARDWALDLEHSGEIQEIHLIGRQHHTLSGASLIIRRDAEPFSWLGNRILSVRPVCFSCARIHADDYPVTLRMYANDNLQFTKVVTNADMFRLPRVRPEREWTIDVVAAASVAVHELAISTNTGGLNRG